ncbi:MAG: protein adenylyltransferase SelO [cyanobacterium endosymbiont of Rhopalodia musculus]|uniref:protein adenylyltransferase SelO n=1 Tax=cyanobacterium endosymbiont of Epithemia clementina EcSB TaxID=3034674 RepID=UPI002480390D|nr:YdiU family protein [cyanobacterium endosymbiont of Epithemia clementina EcSB]WGT67776.1 YdiU family protein [cyanobacterium endosymbiont of Epithemia clementina EcSB]
MIETPDNPFFNLNYEPILENLGSDYYDKVAAAEFPQQILRFRNNELLPLFGLSSETVSDNHFIEAFGKFQGVRPFLALRYHGYQFGQYNPLLGDGRGFLYGQIQGTDNQLYDFGTKGSGQTPYSRGGDGRLTLKGGIREVLAAEALHFLGVKTSRCLSLIETGEKLWRGDEPSPARSSVMIRVNRSHIRFGTFERLYYLKRPDLIQKLLDHVIDVYYPEIGQSSDRYPLFYRELVKRVAKLAAQWMAAGFCHGVLNTDNMSITGESFDYGPYAFIPTYNLKFVAACFDDGGRYSYGNQSFICRSNLEMLHLPLMTVIPLSILEETLAKFDDYYHQFYQKLILRRLGFDNLMIAEGRDLVEKTLEVLQETQISYFGFFKTLSQQFNYRWREDSLTILENKTLPRADWQSWRRIYHRILNQLPIEMMETVENCLQVHNPKISLVKETIETVWEAITYKDDWQPFYNLIKKLQLKG